MLRRCGAPSTGVGAELDRLSIVYRQLGRVAEADECLKRVQQLDAGAPIQRSDPDSEIRRRLDS